MLSCCGCLGLIYVIYKLLHDILPWLYLNIIGPKLLGPKVDIRRMGGWAVITGATDGIGKAYAKALAKKGFNLVLISRSLAKLEAVAKEFTEGYNVEVKIIDIDFTGTVEIFEKIKAAIAGLDIGVLVNNVGISYSHPEYFIDRYEQGPEFLQDIVSANINSLTHMSALILPVMINRKKGAIINVSSTAAVVPSPLVTLYSSTKAFVDKFSEDVQTEYRAKGIVVQCVQPGLVATKMSKIKKASFMVASPDTYVDASLSMLGYCVKTAAYWPHSVQQALVRLAIDLTCEPFIATMLFKQLLSIRKRALRSSQQKSK